MHGPEITPRRNETSDFGGKLNAMEASEPATPSATRSLEHQAADLPHGYNTRTRYARTSVRTRSLRCGSQETSGVITYRASHGNGGFCLGAASTLFAVVGCAALALTQPNLYADAMNIVARITSQSSVAMNTAWSEKVEALVSATVNARMASAIDDAARAARGASIDALDSDLAPNVLDLWRSQISPVVESRIEERTSLLSEAMRSLNQQLTFLKEAQTADRRNALAKVAASPTAEAVTDLASKVHTTMAKLEALSERVLAVEAIGAAVDEAEVQVAASSAQANTLAAQLQSVTADLATLDGRLTTLAEEFGSPESATRHANHRGQSAVHVATMQATVAECARLVQNAEQKNSRAGGTRSGAPAAGVAGLLGEACSSRAARSPVGAPGMAQVPPSHVPAHEEGSLCESLLDVIDGRLALFAADRIAQVDYALESAGGSVVAHSSPYVPSARLSESSDALAGHDEPRSTGARSLQDVVRTIRALLPRALCLRAGLLAKQLQLKVFAPGPVGWGAARPPALLLRPGTDPGQCWAAAGSQARVVVRLSEPVVPLAFTLDHVPAPTARDSRSAPRHVTFWGLRGKPGGTAEPRGLGGDEADLLGEAEFEPSISGYATFPVASAPNGSSPNATLAYDHIELRVESNHGHPLYTCIYRFRVHGTPVRGDGGAAPVSAG